MTDFVRSIFSCVDVVNNQIPSVLVYYSHIPVIVLSIFFALFVQIKNKKDFFSGLFFVFVFLFVLWVVNDLITWILLYDSPLTMFAWSTMELLEVLFFFVSFNFAYNFIFNKKVPNLLNLLFFLPILPVAYLTFTGQVLNNYNIIVCEATENSNVINGSVLFADLFYLIAISVIYLYFFFKNKTKDFSRNLIFISGLIFFLILYLLTLYISTFVENYNWSLIALSGMPIFLAVLAFSAVKFNIFNLKIIGAQILVFISVFIVATQFIFIKSPINMVLNFITVIILLIGGIFLIHSVKKTDEQREALILANKEQESLMHFITHQIKGFLTKSRNIFSMMMEGDYGQVPEEMKPAIAEGFRSQTQGVSLVQDLLNASSMKKGSMVYRRENFDLKKALKDVLGDYEEWSKEKGIKIICEIPDEEVILHGDALQIRNVIKNLVDNAMNYTPKGQVQVKLEKNTYGVRITVADTGIGLSEKDKEHLFMEGGRGLDATKINVGSTGYGLFVAKKIVSTHGGRIWAESAGRGKGSKFIFELDNEPPANQETTSQESANSDLKELKK